MFQFGGKWQAILRFYQQWIGFNFSTSSPTYLLFIFLILVILLGVKQCLIAALMCSSLVTNDLGNTLLRYSWWAYYVSDEWHSESYFLKVMLRLQLDSVGYIPCARQ